MTDTTNSKMKILVVDDSALVRKIIREELTAGGYEVQEATHGMQALVKATTNRPPDLITLDVEMPHLNGFDTCAKLREHHYARHFTNYPDNRVPIIFVTSLDTLEDRKKGFHAGAADFITKPFDKGEILDAVNHILQPGKRLEGLNVLVVEDNAFARKIVSDTLLREGLTVFEAADGIQAFDFMCNKMGEIDLLITDLVMPAMNGDELCAKVRRELDLKNLPIIFLTAVEKQNELLKLFKAGANDYLLKPFAKEELLARIEVHLVKAKLNRRLRENIVELKALNQMKDDLIAVCSHDLRSPLTGILGFTDLLLKKDYLKEEDLENLGQVKTSGEFLLSLVNNILDVSKAQSQAAELEMHPVSMFEIARTSCNALRHMAEAKGQKLDMVDNSTRHVVMGNKSGLVRILNNLLSNAIKFSEQDKKIVMVVENGHDEDVIISVIDQGIGIPEDNIPFLYDKFSKTSREGTSEEKGTGLGMSIIKEMVELHNGRIEVTSEEGKGSCFKIFLPLSSEKILETGDAKSPEGPPQAAPENCSILVAEDNPINRRLAKKFLEEAGHQVTLVDNGRLAAETAQSKKFDLIFMDMNMPEMDGLEATKLLRKAQVNTPIIALTGETSDKSIETCKKAGMDDFLTKPFKAKDLNEKVARYCQLTKTVKSS